MKKTAFYSVSLLFFFAFSSCSTPESKPQKENPPPIEKSDSNLKALIIDGENNHGVWPKTTAMMKQYLEEMGYGVEIKRKKYLWQGPHFNEMAEAKDIKELLDLYPINDGIEHVSVDEPKGDDEYLLDLEPYDLVVSNFGWKSTALPSASQLALQKFVGEGGGLIVVHAANNAWPEWPEYNEMIALGGWGGRNEKDGPYLYYDDKDELIRNPEVGSCGSHGPQHEFVIQTRAADHPIMKGLPTEWLHVKDELYDRLRGPAKNVTVLATAYSDVEKNGPPWDKKTKGSGRHEPMMMAVEYGKGRVFHSILGHMDYSMECVGFITTFKRGAEWAATGKVASTEIPKDFPKADQTSIRAFVWKK